MKLRKYLLLLLAIILFFTSAVSVNASPYQQGQDMEDAIVQALNATAQELGLGVSAEKDFDMGGFPMWDIQTASTHIVIKDNGSENTAQEAFSQFDGVFNQIDFHGYPSYHTTIAFMVHINRYMYICFYVGNTSPAEAMRKTEIFYRHAVASGFMIGDGSMDAPPTETVAPELTLTPGLGTQINLRAYAENYDQATDYIDNSDNFGSVDISGRVTNLDTGAAIGGVAIEITSGAASGSTLSAADGSYSLTAVVSGGQGSGVIGGVDFALPVNADLTIEVTPGSTELLADGTSTSDVTIQVKDLQGNPLKDRSFRLEISADAGPGTIQPAQATTDENGVIHATYTAFKLEPGHGFSNSRHEVTITARDTATGLAGTNWIFVNQYQLSVVYGEYILACTQCTFPSEFMISVSDYWNNPLPNAPLTLRIEGGSSGGTLVLDPNSNATQQEITLTTDNNGNASAYYKWQGGSDIAEAVQRVVITEGVTNAQAAKDVKVHGLDISLARVEEAGFTGVTGQQAFLKIYFKDRAHPDLPLDRFNAISPNKLGLRVTISQYHSDGVNTSLTYENYGGWEQDEKGLFVKMYDTPHMPYIIPLNDGSSWYEVRVDPVTDHDIDLPDLFRGNNDTILVLKTGSPDGWLHIWLQDGILTPHNWAGVVFKCVGRFIPGVGEAMTVIDTLNSVYKLDALGLGGGTASIVTNALESKSNLLPTLKNPLGVTRTDIFSNVVSCMQDSYTLYKEKSVKGSTAASSGKVCAQLPAPLLGLIPFTALDEDDADMISTYQDRFAQGFLLDSPEERGIVIYGLEAGNVTMRDASGIVFIDPEKMSTEGNVTVYILPVDEQFQLEVAGSQAFEIGVYETGSDDTNRKTIRHEVQTDTELTANMAISSTSDYALELDYDGDGVSDETLNAQITTLDVVKPQITNLQPEQGKTVSEKDASILANYTDNPGGVGIDPQATKIFVDGVELTSNADVQPEFLSLILSDIEAGEHTARLIVSDLDGNAAIVEWIFTVKQGFSFSPDNTVLLFAVGGGVFLILLLGAIFVISRRKKHRSQIESQTVEKEEVVKEQQTKPSQPIKTVSKGGSCMVTLVISGLVALLVFSAVLLAGSGFIPGLTIQTTQNVILADIFKMGGGGLLLSLLGILMLRGGIKSIFTRQAVVEDEWGRRTVKHGCSAVLTGITQSFFGLLLLGAGIGLMALSLFQQVLPWLGINLML